MYLALKVQMDKFEEIGGQCVQDMEAGQLMHFDSKIAMIHLGVEE